MPKNSNTKIMVHSAMLLAISLVLGYFSAMIPIGGSGSLRIGISGFFYKLPAFLFGPLYGAIVCGLKDVLSYVIKPEGAYIPPMTLTAILGGVINGVFFAFIRKRKSDNLRIVYIIIVSLIGILGIANHLNILYRPEGVWGSFLLSLKDKSVFLTYGLYVTFIIGAVFYAINLHMMKTNNRHFCNNHLKIFMSLFISDLLVTTLNTFILRIYYSGLGKLPFMVVYAPRLAEELILIFISSYMITYLYGLYRKLDK